jgi:hypothetical protein
VDIETRRQKQQKLMVQLVERKVRSRAEQIYNERGQGEGRALEDWVQAEAEVLEHSILAPLYRRLRATSSDSESGETTADFAAADSSVYESLAEA